MLAPSSVVNVKFCRY